MVTGLANIPSEVFYDSWLIDGPTTQITQRSRFYYAMPRGSLALLENYFREPYLTVGRPLSVLLTRLLIVRRAGQPYFQVGAGQLSEILELRTEYSL